MTTAAIILVVAAGLGVLLLLGWYLWWDTRYLDEPLPNPDGFQSGDKITLRDRTTGRVMDLEVHRVDGLTIYVRGARHG